MSADFAYVAVCPDVATPYPRWRKFTIRLPVLRDLLTEIPQGDPYGISLAGSSRDLIDGLLRTYERT